MSVAQIEYVVRYRPGQNDEIILPSDEGEDILLFICWADDDSHAGEQCEDADPDAEILEVVTASDYVARGGKLPDRS